MQTRFSMMQYGIFMRRFLFMGMHGDCHRFFALNKWNEMVHLCGDIIFFPVLCCFGGDALPVHFFQLNDAAGAWELGSLNFHRDTCI
jgi:hypothetical protein